MLPKPAKQYSSHSFLAIPRILRLHLQYVLDYVWNIINSHDIYDNVVCEKLDGIF